LSDKRVWETARTTVEGRLPLLTCVVVPDVLVLWTRAQGDCDVCLCDPQPQTNVYTARCLWLPPTQPCWRSSRGHV